MEFPSRCHHHRDNLSSCQRPHYRRGNINPKTRKKSGFTLLTMILTLSSLAHCYLPEKYPVKVYHMIQERSQYGIGRDNRIRGTWGPWSPWSDCSRTCGIGVQSQARECIQPSGLGKESVSDGINSTSLKPICIGTYKRYHICNTQECSNLSEDPRAEQCSKFNGRMYKGENYNWIPFLNAPNPCSLNCRAVGQRFYATLEPAVVDGTPCDGPNLRGKSTGFTIDQTEQWLCVAGQCKPVGCDGVIGSGAVRDSCGICGGTGSGCKLFEGIFMEPNLPRGHQPVTIIPKGAMSMNISELRYSGNFLALRAENGSYVLNGPYAVSPSGIYKVAGTILTYQRGDKHRMECITATGPLNESISLEIWYHETNPGVLYKYMLPSTDSLIAPPLYAPASNANDIPNVIPQFTPSKSITREKLPSSEQKPNQSREDVKFSPTVMAGDAPGFNSAENKNKKRKKRKFEWRIVGMTSCSKTCGGGVQNALIKCIKVDREMEVPDKRCRRFEKPQSPPAIPCNDRPCPARWRADDWSECSVTCGTGVKIRKIECVQELNSKLTMRVASGACVQPPDLSTISSCSLPACPETHFSPEVRRMMNSPRDTVPRWEVGAWSSCSSTCGKGTRNRTVTCITTREPCSQSTKPIVEKICETPCNNFSSQHHQESVWLYSEWSSKCMTECGREVETRRVACGDVSELFCNSGSRPATVKHCSANETRKCNDHAKWFTGPWSPCSVMCGEGIIRREVICIGKSSGESKILSENNCREPKPQAEEICRLSACQPEWYMSDWSECSASCGGGTKERVVRCLQDGIVVANCELSIKPREKIPCNVEVCRRDLTHKIPKSMPLNENFLKNEVYVSHKCVDEYPNCASVVKAGLCRMKYYKHSCCGCKK